MLSVYVCVCVSVVYRTDSPRRYVSHSAGKPEPSKPKRDQEPMVGSGNGPFFHSLEARYLG